MVVGDLQRDDLPAIAWSGSASHLRNVAGQLDRVEAGTVEYLVVRDGDGAPVCKGAVDFEETPGAGTIIQVATRPDLQGRGYAQLLIAEAERRTARRGLDRARISVEPGNDRALRLYEWLGYMRVGRRTAGWDTDDGWYATEVIDLEKRL